jgi:hypothetical protein
VSLLLPLVVFLIALVSDRIFPKNDAENHVEQSAINGQVIARTHFAAQSQDRASLSGRDQSPPRTQSLNAPSKQLLALYQDQLRIPSKIYRQLDEWGALPSYAEHAASARADWLASLHSSVTGSDWPREVREAAAGMVEGPSDLAFSVNAEKGRAIVMPIATPVFIRAIVDITNRPMVLPNSSDPNAKMMLDPKKLDDAARDLARLVGTIADVGYLDAVDSEWGGGVIMATRFMYYHELGHLSRGAQSNRQVPKWILPEEQYLAEEILADQFAFGMIVLELRHAPALKAIGFAGIAFAMSLVALQEFAEAPIDGKRKIKNATLRMARLLYWGRLSAKMKTITNADLALGESYWNTFRQLLSRIDVVPSPVFSLLNQTAARPPNDWVVARNVIVRWCVFGQREKLAATLRRVRDSAKEQAAGEPRAQKALQVIAYVLKETAPLEPELGLRLGLEQ